MTECIVVIPRYTAFRHDALMCRHPCIRLCSNEYDNIAWFLYTYKFLRYLIIELLRIEGLMVIAQYIGIKKYFRKCIWISNKLDDQLHYFGLCSYKYTLQGEKWSVNADYLDSYPKTNLHKSKYKSETYENLNALVIPSRSNSPPAVEYSRDHDQFYNIQVFHRKRNAIIEQRELDTNTWNYWDLKWIVSGSLCNLWSLYRIYDRELCINSSFGSIRCSYGYT